METRVKIIDNFKTSVLKKEKKNHTRVNLPSNKSPLHQRKLIIIVQLKTTSSILGHYFFCFFH